MFQPLLLPVRNRLTRRLFGLRPSDELPLRLTPRRIYTLPTRQGLAFGALLLGMLVGAVNYGLSMGYLFTFLLLGMNLAALLATWRNLLGVTLRGVEAQSAFAGEPVRFIFHLAESDGRERSAIAVSVTTRHAAYHPLPARGSVRIAVQIASSRRGRLPLGACRIHTEFPLGLFHAWALPTPGVSALVWPRPEGQRPLPGWGGGAGLQGSGRQRGAEDFDGLRDYVRGETPARIVWKSLARRDEPLAKAFIAPASDVLHLDWAALSDLGTEARLSQLARWVLDADRAGRPYALSLPGLSLPAGSGPVHRVQCLNALALMGTDAAADSDEQR